MVDAELQTLLKIAMLRVATQTARISAAGTFFGMILERLCVTNIR